MVAPPAIYLPVREVAVVAYPKSADVIQVFIVDYFLALRIILQVDQLAESVVLVLNPIALVDFLVVAVLQNAVPISQTVFELAGVFEPIFEYLIRYILDVLVTIFRLLFLSALVVQQLAHVVLNLIDNLFLAFFIFLVHLFILLHRQLVSVLRLRVSHLVPALFLWLRLLHQLLLQLMRVWLRNQYRLRPLLSCLAEWLLRDHVWLQVFAVCQL